MKLEFRENYGCAVKGSTERGSMDQLLESVLEQAEEAEGVLRVRIASATQTQQYLPPAYISTGTMLGSYSAISTSVPVGGRWQTIVDARVECELFDPDTGKSVWFGGADVRAPSHMIHTSIAREAASGLAKVKLVKMGRPFGKEQR